MRRNGSSSAAKLDAMVSHSRAFNSHFFDTVRHEITSVHKKTLFQGNKRAAAPGK